MVANPSAFDPIAHPQARQGAARPRPAGHARSSTTSPARSTTQGTQRAAAHRSRHRAARGADGGAVLHQLAAARRSWPPWACGVSPERRRVPRLLRRPEDPHHDRSPDAAGRRAGDLADLPSGPGEPAASLVAIDNRTGQVRAMVGGPLVNGQEDFQKYPFNLATQGHRQPGLGVQAVHAGGRAPARLRARFRDRLQAAEPDRAQQRRQGALHGQELRQPVLGADHARLRHRDLGQQRVHPGRALPGRRHQADRPDGHGDGDPLAGVQQLRDDHRRAQGGRVATRHGACLRDDRHGGRRVYNPRPGRPGRGPDRHRPDPVPGRQCRGKRDLSTTPHYKRVIPPASAADDPRAPAAAWSNGTGTSAAISGVDVAGKTGTTTNYGDAWFVGWTPQIDDRGVGRLPEQARPDDHPLQRRAGRGRHLPGRSSGTTS